MPWGKLGHVQGLRLLVAAFILGAWWFERTAGRHRAGALRPERKSVQRGSEAPAVVSVPEARPHVLSVRRPIRQQRGW